VKRKKSEEIASIDDRRSDAEQPAGGYYTATPLKPGISLPLRLQLPAAPNGRRRPIDAADNELGLTRLTTIIAVTVIAYTEDHTALSSEIYRSGVIGI